MDFQLVIAGTAWHWVDPVAGAAGTIAAVPRQVAPDSPFQLMNQFTSPP